MFQCITVAKIKDGTLDEIIKAANILAEATRKEAGNIYYYLLQPANAKDTLIFSEAWESEANFLTHVEGAPCKNFGKIMDPSSAGAPQIYPCNVLV